MRIDMFAAGTAALVLAAGSALAAPAHVGGGVGAGAGLGVGGGLGAGVGAGAQSQIPDRMSANGSANTTLRGARDVLPDTSASARGTARGSMSTDRALQGGASTSMRSPTGDAHAAATTDLRAGALVKDGRGAAVGRIDEVIRSSTGTVTGVVIGIGSRKVTVPPSSLSASGDFLVSTADRDALLAR